MSTHPCAHNGLHLVNEAGTPTTAMHLLQAGEDLAVIALWLGHESIMTTHQYLDADRRVKQKALAALQPPQATEVYVATPADVLAFLDSL